MSAINLHCCTIDPGRRVERQPRLPDFCAFNDAVVYFCKRLNGSDMRVSEAFLPRSSDGDQVDRERVGSYGC